MPRLGTNSPQLDHHARMSQFPQNATRRSQESWDSRRFVSDPGNFPSWNSAVRDVRPTSAAANSPGSTYTMKRQLPTGGATNELEILACEQPLEFAIRTINGPTPFLYRYRFGVRNGETIVQLDAQVELDGIAAFVPQLARLAVKHGVDDNLATLKLILEQRHAGVRVTSEPRESSSPPLEHLMAEAMTNPEIGAPLALSPRTIAYTCAGDQDWPSESG
jgi:hypothetical protein